MASRGSSSRSSEPGGVDTEDRDPRKKARDAERARRGRAVKYRLGRALRVARNIALLGVALAALGVAAAIGVVVHYGNDPKMPNVRSLSDYHPRQLTKVVDREGKLIGELGTEHRTMMPLAKMPKVFINAVLAAEDPTFYQHEGLDYRGIVRAIFMNVFEGRAQGGSTITQQVVKQLLLTPEKTARRKVQEWILARRISQTLSKDEILEIYLNQNNYGHGRYGCEEGARYYFAKSIGDVTLGEAALLAGLFQSPERLSPRKHAEAAKTRQRYVLGQMASYGFITRVDAEKVAAQPIVLAPEPAARVSAAPEAVDLVHRQLVDRVGADKLQALGATVKTTLDLRLQELAREAVDRGLEDLDGRQGYRGPSGHAKSVDKQRALLATEHPGPLRDGEIIEGVVERVDKDPANPKHLRLVVAAGGGSGVVDLAAEARYAAGKGMLADRFKAGDLVRVRAAPERRRAGDPATERSLALELGPQAAMVVMDPQSREILALVGGYPYRAGGFDRALRAARQAGSAFKPFLYAAAIESRRYTAASVVNDAPDVYDKWKPQNYEKEQFRGPVRLREALAHSINTVPIKLLADIGIPTVRDMAQRAGITSELPDSLAMALGAGSVTPLELANAYATFAAGGQRGEPHLVAAIGDDPIVPAALQPAMRAETAYILVSLMRSVVEDGTAKGVAARLRRPVAGKTGTTSDNKDAWFVGFTPDLLAAVWVGFDDMKDLGRKEVGARAALPIWLDFMARALATRPVRDFAQPAGVVVTPIDPATGLLVAAGGEGLDEVFIAGTEPHETAPAKGEETSADKLLLDRN